MIQRRILFFVVMMFTVVFAYGGRKDKAWAKSVNEGLALFAQEKYEAAIEKFDEALRIVPKTWYAVQQKVYCLNKLGRNEEALRVLEKSLEEGGEDYHYSQMYYLYATLQLDKVDNLTILDYCTKAFKDIRPEEYPLKQNLHFMKAMVYLKLTDTEKNKVVAWGDSLTYNLGSSVAMAPKYAYNYMLLGSMYEGDDQNEYAICSYAMFLATAGEKVDDLYPVLGAWSGFDLTMNANVLSFTVLNKVKEVISGEMSEYGGLYDLFAATIPLICTGAEEKPQPIASTTNLYANSIIPFFSELIRRELLEAFLHYSLKDSKTNYLNNSHWLLEHPDKKQRLLETLKELKLFGEE